MAGFWSRLFGGGGSQSSSADGGIYVSVQCAACNEVIRIRINPSSDLSLADSGGYFVRKVAVGQECFRPIEVQMRFSDLGGSLIAREITGGSFIDESSAARRI